jgi:hypothetical protein
VDAGEQFLDRFDRHVTDDIFGIDKCLKLEIAAQACSHIKFNVGNRRQ